MTICFLLLFSVPFSTYSYTVATCSIKWSKCNFTYRYALLSFCRTRVAGRTRTRTPTHGGGDGNAAHLPSHTRPRTRSWPAHNRPATSSLRQTFSYRRRINTEEKVVDAVWGTEFIPFLAALAVLHHDDLKITVGWMAPGWFEEKHEFIPFFKIVPLQNSYRSKVINKIFPPNRRDKLCLFILIILLLWLQPSISIVIVTRRNLKKIIYSTYRSSLTLMITWLWNGYSIRWIWFYTARVNLF